MKLRPHDWLILLLWLPLALLMVGCEYLGDRLIQFSNWLDTVGDKEP